MTYITFHITGQVFLSIKTSPMDPICYTAHWPLSKPQICCWIVYTALLHIALACELHEMQNKEREQRMGQAFVVVDKIPHSTLEYLSSVSSSTFDCNFPFMWTLGGSNDASSVWVPSTHRGTSSFHYFYLSPGLTIVDVRGTESTDGCPFTLSLR